jgi:hypothetical protein
MERTKWPIGISLGCSKQFKKVCSDKRRYNAVTFDRLSRRRIAAGDVMLICDEIPTLVPNVAKCRGTSQTLVCAICFARI